MTLGFKTTSFYPKRLNLNNPLVHTKQTQANCVRDKSDTQQPTGYEEKKLLLGGKQNKLSGGYTTNTNTHTILSGC